VDHLDGEQCCSLHRLFGFFVRGQLALELCEGLVRASSVLLGLLDGQFVAQSSGESEVGCVFGGVVVEVGRGGRW